MNSLKETPLGTRLTRAAIDRYLTKIGAEFTGPWGKYLDRYRIFDNGNSIDALIPRTNEIADYSQRMRDFVTAVAELKNTEFGSVVHQIGASQFTTFSIRARVGLNTDSIGFDEGLAVIENAKEAIKSSALATYSPTFRPTIRGRMPEPVGEFMDRLEIGQTEVGSFVFNFLIPDGPDETDEALEGLEVHGQPDVAEKLRRGLEALASMRDANRAPSEAILKELALPANFYEAIYEIVDWTGGVSLELGSSSDAKDGTTLSLNRDSLALLERVANRISPEAERTPQTIVGTITKLSEPNIRRRGSLDLRIKNNGRLKSVRVTFGFEDRDTVISAFREKASRALSVKGQLTTEKSGRLRLEEPQSFKLVARGPLV